MKVYSFSKKEEIVHAITHGIGAVLSMIGLILLISYAKITGDLWQIVSVTIFGITMLMMYLASTIVHSLPKGKWKDLFLIFDHATIYLFIAGSYTPFLLVHLRGEIGWTLFIIVWGIAIIGIIFKVFYVKRFIILSTIFYILMGWLIIIAWEPLTTMMHDTGVTLLVTGGLFYTIGTIFYIWRGFPYHHAVWHLFVLVGSAFHFFTVFYYVI
ncbi:hemolysin III family protein [Ornithinibacillus sp. L9]|uniref:Hemolysin III family protein n=1 Tax=Ornithinibacillus caprae TaxID=2678566 RepID=A0A6N8FNW7_9BACI|nr:hemolysin III family protein [Ornithinibacillus caprae]MUK90234.1 hemolysin III family protein [Ornithinibacillus caprae]